MSIAYNATKTSVTAIVEMVPVTIPHTHPNFSEIIQLVRKPDATEAELKALLTIKPAIEQFESGNVVIKDGRLFYKGFEIRSTLSKLILDIVADDDRRAAKPFELFLERSQQNPDPRAAADLYDWVAASGLPITQDGFILAWKAVREDYFSIHGNNGSTATDRRFDHHIGNTVEQDRTTCDANPDRTCSTGLHFCAASYLSSYGAGGSRVVVVKIDPADVVAFPKDYNNAKGRAAKYVIVGEVPRDQVATYYPQGRRVTDKFREFDTRRSIVDIAVKAKAVERDGLMAVGQTWKDRLGNLHKIDGINLKGTQSVYSVRTTAGAEYTNTGRYYNKKRDERDLVTLVSDVK